jgi:co-chaperonin GroES (HSP10)|tara:strand:- start:9 stop:317 length:309 start_codon:yes stop_codon:yes gene_type:complete
MEYSYRPLGDRVVVEILKRHDEKTKGGLYKPSGSETTMMGVVIAVGSGLYTHSGATIPMSTKVGDTVLLDGTGFKHKNGGKTYNIYRESDFLSILDEDTTNS